MSAATASVLAVVQRLHHGVIALVFAGVVLLLVLFLSAVALMSALALLHGGGLEQHLPGAYFTVIALMILLVDLVVAVWAGMWSYRLMKHPPEPYPQQVG